MFPIVRLNPLNDNSYWYYVLKEPIQDRGAQDSHSITTLNPPPPSLTFHLFFATKTIFWAMPGSTIANVPMRSETTESKVFTMDINSFTDEISADQAIYSMFMNTMTGSSFSQERRLWMVMTLSDSILHYFHSSNISSSSTTLDANITFELDVVDEIHRFLYDEVMEEEEDEDHFGQDLLEDEFFQDHEVEDDQFFNSFEDVEEYLSNEEFYEDVEYYNLSICPASPALVESLKTEVYQQSDEEGEAEDCVICLDEFVARVEVKRLPCSHCFHVHCIDGWFQRKDTCPLCRTKLQAQTS